MTSINNIQPSKAPFYTSLVAILALTLIYWFGLPITIGYDPNEDRCLPDARWSLLVHHTPSSIHDGDMIFFSRPAGTLDYVKQQYVMKIVGGVPGDHITINNGDVRINGKIVVTGFPLAQKFYHHSSEFYDKDEVIPKGKFFMIAPHPFSDDSRYWGYLDAKYVRGIGYKIF